jgi:hypothetical protein
VAVAIVVVAEAGLRLAGLGDPPIAVLDDAIEYYPRPAATFHRFGNEISINRHGMRSPDFEKGGPAAPGWLLLGDSVVYGNHFLDQRETLAAVLGREGVPTAALAASSWGPGNLLAYWRRFGPFSGEVAVIVQSAHDRADVPFTSTDIIPYRTRTSWCALDDALQMLVERSRRAMSGDDDAPVSLTYEERLAASERALRELVAELKEHIDRVVLVYHPTWSELRGDVQGERDHFRALAASLGIESTSAFEPGALTDDELERLFKDDIHPSAEGARFIAAHLVAALGAEAAAARRGR